MMKGRPKFDIRKVIAKAMVFNNAKPKPLLISVSAQTRYASEIDNAVAHMVQEVNDKVGELFRSDAAKSHVATFDSVDTMDAPSVGSQARILTAAFKKQFDKLFGDLAKTLAANMVASLNDSSKQSIKTSLNAAHTPLQMQGKKLTLNTAMLDPATVSILKSSVAYATNFIQSIPENYLTKVTDAVLRSVQGGNGLQDLVPFLDKQGSTVKNWAHNTAMDQTRKVYNSLNRSRMMSVGVKRGKWVHSAGSQYPRERHQDFDGQSFKLSEGAPVGDDGGNLVQPGEEPNCRCTFTPILDDLFSDAPEDDD